MYVQTASVSQVSSLQILYTDEALRSSSNGTAELATVFRAVLQEDLNDSLLFIQRCLLQCPDRSFAVLIVLSCGLRNQSERASRRKRIIPGFQLDLFVLFEVRVPFESLNRVSY